MVGILNSIDKKDKWAIIFINVPSKLEWDEGAFPISIDITGQSSLKVSVKFSVFDYIWSFFSGAAIKVMILKVNLLDSRERLIW